MLASVSTRTQQYLNASTWFSLNLLVKTMMTWDDHLCCSNSLHICTQEDIEVMVMVVEEMVVQYFMIIY